MAHYAQSDMIFLPASSTVEDLTEKQMKLMNEVAKFFNPTTNATDSKILQKVTGYRGKNESR